MANTSDEARRALKHGLRTDSIAMGRPFHSLTVVDGQLPESRCIEILTKKFKSRGGWQNKNQ